MLKIAPSHLSVLLEDAGAEVLPKRFLILGGEPLTFGLLQRIGALRRRSGSRCRVVNH